MTNQYQKQRSGNNNSLEPQGFSFIIITKYKIHNNYDLSLFHNNTTHSKITILDPEHLSSKPASHLHALVSVVLITSTCITWHLGCVPKRFKRKGSAYAGEFIRKCFKNHFKTFNQHACKSIINRVSTNSFIYKQFTTC